MRRYPTLSAKPSIRAHLAPFLYDSDCGHLRFGKLPCPHIRKNAICNPSSRFGGSVLSAKPRPKEPERLFFCGGESGIADIHFWVSGNLAVLLVFMLIVLLFVLGGSDNFSVL